MIKDFVQEVVKLMNMGKKKMDNWYAENVTLAVKHAQVVEKENVVHAKMENILIIKTNVLHVKINSKNQKNYFFFYIY